MKKLKSGLRMQNDQKSVKLIYDIFEYDISSKTANLAIQFINFTNSGVNTIRFM